MWYLCYMVYFSITCGIRSYCFLKTGYTKSSQNWIRHALYQCQIGSYKQLFIWLHPALKTCENWKHLNNILQSWHRFLTNYKTPWLPISKTENKNSAKSISVHTQATISMNLTITTKLQSANLAYCQGEVKVKWTTSSTQGSPVNPAHTVC